MRKITTKTESDLSDKLAKAKEQLLRKKKSNDSKDSGFDHSDFVTIAVIVCAMLSYGLATLPKDVQESSQAKNEVVIKEAAISKDIKESLKIIQNDVSKTKEPSNFGMHLLRKGTPEELQASIDKNREYLDFCDSLKMVGTVRSFKRSWVMSYQCKKGDFEYSNTINYNFRTDTREHYEVKMLFEIDKQSGYKIEYSNKENYVGRVGTETISALGSIEALADRQLGWVNKVMKYELQKNLKTEYDKHVVESIL
ncbi:MULTISPECIES: hypothetical protein [Vibrio harveyi group]|uniref:hypothetical protein n=1 Tax=Vibrio harveyi group TaxID=717610 RepID=UPI0006A659F5|nr:hypothetical protein [Vibrio diabolicus]KOE93934.1 hypothetical protein ACS91_00980 [Vibrio parahaemolyticus]MCS0311709.1 hypothetical protein [Vibrio diabolicus]